ncbi:hypothetical protein FEM48_Zijuj01G0057700 [Ziziphus jujuba var. spinosa]|uniref:Ribosome maturation factor RimM n=1 Tax=Ziziphus jujuba var. spinosa TaxID=714518 RepID=A0A978VZG9_ZIZJJ|nr:hypothetical protein FEM48_Zijuj01G0057700 [Ziziphus jujuba var. spinosa]
MQRASILCYSNPLHPVTPLPASRSLAPPSRSRPSRKVSASAPAQFPFYRLHNHRLSLPVPPLQSTATQEHVEAAEIESGSIEVGYVSNVHGLHGEVRVKPSTDFPELRFSKAGRRWLKQQVSGREMIQEVELVEGRGHPGQKSWILKFRGIDSVDQAKLLIGSTLLVREEERPELEEGEFYTRDLVGMRVYLKETGELVGTVVNVFNSGASDLLHVMLDSIYIIDATEKQKSEGARVSEHLVWIPFVEAIVPDVDLKKREMHITPPKGLLELNLRFDDRSKKERRQLEWKERKKFQKRLIAAKKKLCEIEQKHVFHGLRFGEKSQRSLLADQIVGMNSKLLQQALQDIEMSSKRWNITDLVGSIKTKQTSSTLSISEDCFTSSASREKLAVHFHLHEKGLHLTSEGKVAIVLVVNDSDKQGWGGDLDLVESQSTANSPYMLLADDQRFIKVRVQMAWKLMEARESVPLILVCSAHEVQSLTTLFSNNDHFGFDPEKVRFLEEEKLPVVSNSLDDDKKHKILMKSPWEILQSPVGSGGVISLLSSHDILENLSQMGVEYLEVRHIALYCSIVKTEFLGSYRKDWDQILLHLASFNVDIDLYRKVTQSCGLLLPCLDEMQQEIIVVLGPWLFGKQLSQIICSTSQRFVGLNSILLGFVESCKADIGMQIFKDTVSEENFNMVYSMNFMKKLTKKINELKFFAIPKQSSHVEMIDKEWVDVIPSFPNSFELHSSIYSPLDACSYDKVCLMEITE